MGNELSHVEDKINDLLVPTLKPAPLAAADHVQVLHGYGKFGPQDSPGQQQQQQQQQSNNCCVTPLGDSVPTLPLSLPYTFTFGVTNGTEAVGVLLDGNSIEIEVQRADFVGRTLLVKYNPGDDLGAIFKFDPSIPGVVVSQISPSKAWALAGDARTDDVVVSVDGKSMLHSKPELLLTALASAAHDQKGFMDVCVATLDDIVELKRRLPSVEPAPNSVLTPADTLDASNSNQPSRDELLQLRKLEEEETARLHIELAVLKEEEKLQIEREAKALKEATTRRLAAQEEVNRLKSEIAVRAKAAEQKAKLEALAVQRISMEKDQAQIESKRLAEQLEQQQLADTSGNPSLSLDSVGDSGYTVSSANEAVLPNSLSHVASPSKGEGPSEVNMEIKSLIMPADTRPLIEALPALSQIKEEAGLEIKSSATVVSADVRPHSSETALDSAAAGSTMPTPNVDYHSLEIENDCILRADKNDRESAADLLDFVQLEKNISVENKPSSPRRPSASSQASVKSVIRQSERILALKESAKIEKSRKSISLAASSAEVGRIAAEVAQMRKKSIPEDDVVGFMLATWPACNSGNLLEKPPTYLAVKTRLINEFGGASFDLHKNKVKSILQSKVPSVAHDGPQESVPVQLPDTTTASFVEIQPSLADEDSTKENLHPASTGLTAKPSSSSSITKHQDSKKLKSARRCGAASVAILGSCGVGKSAIGSKLMKSEHWHSPTEVCCVMEAVYTTQKSKHTQEHFEISIEIRDTSGDERYRNLTQMYLRGASAAVIVYDVFRRDTFSHALTIIQDLKDEIPIMVLVGNTFNDYDPDILLLDDPEAREVMWEEAEAYAKFYNLLVCEAPADLTDVVNEIFDAITIEIASKQFPNLVQSSKEERFKDFQTVQCQRANVAVDVRSRDMSFTVL